jgi:hypothetical protein
LLMYSSYMFITCKCWARVAERISSAVKLFIITGQFGCYAASVVISEKLYTSQWTSGLHTRRAAF